MRNNRINSRRENTISGDDKNPTTFLVFFPWSFLNSPIHPGFQICTQKSGDRVIGPQNHFDIHYSVLTFINRWRCSVSATHQRRPPQRLQLLFPVLSEENPPVEVCRDPSVTEVARWLPSTLQKQQQWKKLRHDTQVTKHNRESHNVLTNEEEKFVFLSEFVKGPSLI